MIDPFHLIHLYGTLGLCMAFVVWGSGSLAGLIAAIVDWGSQGAKPIAGICTLSLVLCLTSAAARLI